jgi:hypothetical protein
MTQITRETIDKIHSLLDQGLVRGLGKPVPGQMCVEAAINYALGRPHGDDPGCVATSLRQLKITLNDLGWSSNVARANGMRRLAIAQLGSKGVLDEALFARRCALSVAHLWKIPDIVRKYLETGDKSIMLEARYAVADASASADASAAASADAAHAAAYAAAYAAHATAYAAAAAAAAEDSRAAAAHAAAEAASAAASADAAHAAHAAAHAAAYAAHAAAYAAHAAAYAARAAADAAAADAARAAADAAAADAARAAAAAAAAASADAASDKVLSDFAESIVQILIEIRAPGVQWL